MPCCSLPSGVSTVSRLVRRDRLTQSLRTINTVVGTEIVNLQHQTAIKMTSTVSHMVLLVDDVEDILDQLRYNLEREGNQV